MEWVKITFLSCKTGDAISTTQLRFPVYDILSFIIYINMEHLWNILKANRFHMTHISTLCY